MTARHYARRIKESLILGVAVALLGVVAAGVWPGIALEQAAGLDWLFLARGQRAAPEDVVIVSLDTQTANALDLPDDPRLWPRRLHAELVDALRRAGAAVIVFDIYFKDARGADDQVLANAMRRAGNVILSGYLKREFVDIAPSTEGGAPAVIDALESPTATLAEAAAGVAPFTLPTRPVKVSGVLLFHDAAGLPSLPVVALQAYMRGDYPTLRAALSAVRPAIVDVLPRAADVVLAPDFTGLAARLRAGTRPTSGSGDPRRLVRRRIVDVAPATRRRLEALVDLYAGDDHVFLNFYGPPRSITTIPYTSVLEGAARDVGTLRGKAVFVGFSERRQPQQRDGFYTVFSRADGLDLSGVELAATVFANLLDGSTLRPPSVGMLLGVLAVFGLIAGAAARLAPPLPAAALSAALGLAYTGLVFALFVNRYIWLPVAIPVLLQIPAALLLAVGWHYVEANRDRHQMRHAFNFYLPRDVVAELSAAPGRVAPRPQLRVGACLATDVERYTDLAERLSPARVAELLNRYYQVLFEPVRQSGGMISDVVGDAMLALWIANGEDEEYRTAACRAALNIGRAVDAFNRANPDTPLPTRIGLHAGDVLLGAVGAGDHFEYRAVGDMVNSASRIQALNKSLSTRILASAEALRGLHEFGARRLGRFTLRGKREPLALYELIGRRDELGDEWSARIAAFENCLQRFDDGCWTDAGECFQRYLQTWPDDGPAAFFLQQCRADARRGRDGERASAVTVET